jgi:serine protease Do
MKRRSLFVIVASLFLAAVGLPYRPASAVAQDSDNGLELTADQEANSREEEYRQLAIETAALEQSGRLLKKVVKLVTPTVVHIESYKSDAASRGLGLGSPIEEAGSGVVIRLDEHYYVLTNRHVIKDAALDNVRIRLHDGRYLQPTAVWSDSETDVATIRVAAQDLVTARLGDSDQVDIGDFVLAVGSPFGLSHSVTFGIISAKGRRDLDLGSDEIWLQDFLQTDAAINPGNSGGPLLNMRGEVIGINTAIASSSGGNEGVSFAIPIRMVMFVARQLVRKGYVEHAYLGVTLDNLFGMETARELGLPRLQGALIKQVRPKSPAYFANLKENDVIVSYNGQVVEDDDHLVNLVSMTPVNQSVTLEVIRNRKPVQITIKVGRRPNVNRSLPVSNR